MSHPTRRLIIDSGAFSVWTKGTTIDLGEYIAYCEKFPDVTYYVNLDVIPGRFGDKASLTKDAVEESCKQGWKNWKQMIQSLPFDKVIPVFHQGDPIKWLDKYLAAGVKYIGISPANDRRTAGKGHTSSLRIWDAATTKLQWVRSLRPYLFDGSGRPTVKTHGFAVTSYDLMKCMEWYSVDSASWKLAGAWGNVYVPAPGKDFSVEPEQLRVSPNPRGETHGKILKSLLNHRLPNRLYEWLEECGVPLGSFKVVQKDEEYKLNRDREEIWFDKQKRQVLRPVEKGVLTAVEERLRVNAEFMHRAAKALKDYVRHIYFAGAIMPYPLEFDLGNRLLSFAHTSGESGQRYVRKHCKLIRKHK